MATVPNAGPFGLPIWSVALPALGAVALAVPLEAFGAAGTIAAAAILIGAVLAAVHHAEVVAHNVGEPFGTLVLALAVTIIEVSLIVSLMLSGGGDAATLARDTVFAAIMVILNGIVGVCLLAGGVAKTLPPTVEAAVIAAGLPLAVVGIVIAVVVLAPESLAAFHAARCDRLQTSLNLALGSALATIGLTIPAVAIVSLVIGLPVEMGLDAKGMTLLALSLFVATLSLGTGRTTVLQGTVHLVILAAYLFTTVVP